MTPTPLVQVVKTAHGQRAACGLPTLTVDRLAKEKDTGAAALICHLESGTGLAVLIGGTGNDHLDARDASILLGGTTDFDANIATLRALLSEWSVNDGLYES